MKIYKIAQVYNNLLIGIKGFFILIRIGQNTIKLPAIIDTSLFYSHKFLKLIDIEKNNDDI